MTHQSKRIAEEHHQTVDPQGRSRTFGKMRTALRNLSGIGASGAFPANFFDFFSKTHFLFFLLFSPTALHNSKPPIKSSPSRTTSVLFNRASEAIGAG